MLRLCSRLATSANSSRSSQPVGSMVGSLLRMTRNYAYGRNPLDLNK